MVCFNIDYKVDKGRGEICLKDLKNICSNLKCRQQSCSLRKWVGGEEVQPVARGCYSNSCEILGSGEVSRWYVKGEHS